MSFLLNLAFIFSFQQSDLVFKPNEEFQLETDFKFKARQATDPSTVSFVETREEHDEKKYHGAPLPYLILNFKILKFANGEERVKVVNTLGEVLLNKKAASATTFKLDLGFTDDMKDRVTPYDYKVYFLSGDKKALSYIHLVIQEDGTFLVNDEQRGKF